MHRAESAGEPIYGAMRIPTRVPGPKGDPSSAELAGLIEAGPFSGFRPIVRPRDADVKS